jgi:hypothetical protein
MILTTKQKRFFWWCARVMVLLSAISGLLAASGLMGGIGTQLMGAAAAIAGIFSKWCTDHLPAQWKPVAPKGGSAEPSG